MKKKSLSDIAAEMNVSKTLVSFVLNGRGDEKGISPKTQERVKQVAKAFNYKPNHFARGLRLGKTQTIGLIVADISNKFYAKIARQVERVASLNNYNLIIASSDENPDKELQLINMLRDRQIDGLIISTTHKDSRIFSLMSKESYPYVLIDRNLPKLNSHFVGCDNYNGAYKATNHIIENGYKKIGLLKVSPDHISSIKERELGYRAALKENGLRVHNKLIQTIDFAHIRSSVRQVLQEFIQAPNSIDAVFSLNNNITVACMEYFDECKIRIPQDIALVSFDDIELFRFSYPKITALAQPVDEIGEHAVKILLAEIKGEKLEKQKLILPTELLKRRSTGIFVNQSTEIVNI